ncbi:MAG TPA: hypothetical protein VG965_03815 [Patescibacteria group bacterium]|nr:hypothetical protein [Patescibacteria group bacterium]
MPLALPLVILGVGIVLVVALCVTSTLQNMAYRRRYGPIEYNIALGVTSASVILKVEKIPHVGDEFQVLESMIVRGTGTARELLPNSMIRITGQSNKSIDTEFGFMPLFGYETVN